MNDELPLDPDVEVDRRARGPVHLRPSALLLVAAGGTAGTAAREALTLAFPTRGLPLTLLLINVGGAFLLGVLLEALVRRGPDEGRRRDLRLLIGTGALGGFTTYSAFATDVAGLLGSGAVPSAILDAALTLLGGVLATTAGIAAAAIAHRARTGRAA